MITPSSIPSADRGTHVSATGPGSLEHVRGFDRPFARVSWGSIFAGAVLALAIQLVLTLIGVAIGLATLDPATGDSPSGASLGMGAGIWWCISSMISLFLGGYVAARLGGTFNGWLHGLTTWGTVTMLTIVLLTTAAGTLVGSASGLANFAASNSDKAAQVQLPPAIQQQLDRLQAQAGQAADQASAQAQQAGQQAQAAVQQPGTQPAEAKAREAADRAATGGAMGTGGAAIALLLGAAAAAFGGKTGQRLPGRDDLDDDYRGTTVSSAGTSGGASTRV